MRKAVWKSGNSCNALLSCHHPTVHLTLIPVMGRRGPAERPVSALACLAVHPKVRKTSEPIVISDGLTD
jgi:hypothetical protein